MHSLYTVDQFLRVFFGDSNDCRYVLDVGQSEDWFALQIAMAPCLIGYGMIARRLFDDPKTKRDGNIYWKWIENYVAEDYVEAVQIGSGKEPLELQGLGDVEVKKLTYRSITGEARHSPVSESYRRTCGYFYPCYKCELTVTLFSCLS